MGTAMRTKEFGIIFLSLVSWNFHGIKGEDLDTEPSKKIFSMTFENTGRRGESKDSSKTVTLDTKDGKSEKIRLVKTQGIMSPNIKLEVCSKDCEQKATPDVTPCIYEGKIIDDPDSVVNVMGCEEDDVDITIVSTKKDFGATTMRKTKEGKIETMKYPFEADE